MLIEKAKCTVETKKAILVEALVFEEPMWIPKSQVDTDSEVYKKGTDGDLIISDWWAEQQGWM